MRVYLDDDVAAARLTRLLRAASHDVQLPSDVGLAGEDDPTHLTQAIRDKRVLLTRNYGDYEKLHLLIVEAGGHHSGILVERFDADPKHNLTPADIVRALRNVETAGISLTNQYYILNQWK
jgi:uncharacterized protein with PIN domain